MATVIDTLVTRFSFVADAAELREIDQQITSLRSKINSLGNKLIVAGGTASGGLLGIVSAGIKTDRSLRELMTVTDQSAETFKDLKNQAYEVGADLPLMTADIIDAQKELFKFGLSLKQVMTLTPAVAQTTVAVQGNLKQVALNAAQVMAVFEFGAEELSLALDKLALMPELAAAEFEELAGAIGDSGEAAKNAGVSYEDFLAILGNLKEGGVDVASGSTGLNFALTQIARVRTAGGDVNIRGAEMIKELLQVVGMDADEMGRIMDQEHGFIKLLNEMYKRAPDEAALTSVFAQTFGVANASGFVSLARRANDVLEDSERLIHAQGESAKDAETSMGGLSGAWDKFKSVMDNVRNILNDLISDDIEGWIRKVASALEDLFRKNEDGELVNHTLLSIVAHTLKWLTLLIAVGAALKTISVLMLLIGFILKTSLIYRLTTMALNVKGIRAAIIGVGRSLGLAGKQAGKLSAIMSRVGLPNATKLILSAIASSVSFVVLKFIALGLAIAAVIIYWDEITAAISRFWEKAKSGDYGVIVRTWARAFEVLGEAIEEDIKKLQTYASEFEKWRQDVNRSIDDLVKSIASDVSGAMSSAAQSTKDWLMEFDLVKYWVSQLDLFLLKWGIFWDQMLSGLPDWIKYIFGIDEKQREIKLAQQNVTRVENEIELSKDVMQASLEELDNALNEKTRADLAEEFARKSGDDRQAKIEKDLYNLADTNIKRIQQDIVAQQKVLNEQVSDLSKARSELAYLETGKSVKPISELESELLQLKNQLETAIEEGHRQKYLRTENEIYTLEKELETRKSNLKEEFGDLKYLKESNYVDKALKEKYINAKERIQNGLKNILPDMQLTYAALDTSVPIYNGRSATAIEAQATTNNNGGNRTMEMGDIYVDINAPGADSNEISENVGEKLRDQFNLVTDEADSNIAR